MINRRKKRYARRLDSSRFYKPEGVTSSKLETVNIKLDEFEAMRLVDYEGLSQIEAGDEMQVSRATIQRLLITGRKKFIDVLLFSKALEIKNEITNIKLKGENNMNIEERLIKKISFPTSDKVTVDGHFGHCKEFVIYTVEENEVKEVNYVKPPEHIPGSFPKFLGEHNIDVIITGGMGTKAVNLFKQQDIDVVLGAKGRIDVNLSEYLGGFLTSKGSMCEHDSEKHHNHNS